MVVKLLNYKIPLFPAFLALILIILAIWNNKSFSYEKLVYPEGKEEELIDLFFKSLQKKKADKWSLAPKDISLEDYYLIPYTGNIISIFHFEIKYPLEGIYYQSFLERNLRFLLADQTQNIANLEEELKKKRELHERARKILGKYYNEFFKQKEEKIIASEHIDLTKILTTKQKSDKDWGQTQSIRIISQNYKLNYDKYFQEIEKRKSLSFEREKEERVSSEKGSILEKMASFIFSSLDWLEKNKSIFIVAYLFILFLWIIFSGGK